MNNKSTSATWFIEPIQLTGTLSYDQCVLPISFSAAVDTAGETILNFSSIKCTANSKFIYDSCDSTGERFAQFTLKGESPTGTLFTSKDVIITGTGCLFFFEDETPMNLVAHCSTARITRSIENTETSNITVRTIGLQLRKEITVPTPLGSVAVFGAPDADKSDAISGSIEMHRPMTQTYATWREEASQLCEHVRYAMSFSASAMIDAPIISFIDSGVEDIRIAGQMKKERIGMPPINWLENQNFLICAITFYFRPTIEANNLRFAIEWFTMRHAYPEAQLISSMTVLENLVDSNLNPNDKCIVTPEQFEALRKKLSKAVKEEATTWTSVKAEHAEFVADFNERFLDLQRRSLLDKVYLLAQRWKVNLNGIDRKFIEEAKKARDHVVHRGLYSLKPDAERDLLDHLLLTRELVARFILTVFEFEGRYCSYIGGYHQTKFLRTVE